MAYIPPAVHQRNRAFIRPSGVTATDISAQTGTIGLGIRNMPPYGHVYVDGVMLPDAGEWIDGVWLVQYGGTGTVLRVTSRDGSEARETEGLSGGDIHAGVEFDWNTMTPVADAPTALRVLNGPIGGGTLWIDGQPVAPLPATPAWNGHSVNWPAGEAAVRIQTPAGEVRTAVVTVPSNLDFNAMTVMAPAASTGPRPTVDFTMGGGFNIGGAGGGSASGFTITGIPSTATGMAVRIDGQNANGNLAGGVWTANDALPAGRSVMAQVRLQQGAGLSAFLLAPVERRVDVPASGTVSVPFSSFAAPSAAAPPAPATGNLTVTGMPGWVVAIALPGSTVPLAPPATIPPTGGITVPAPVGSYDLAVSDGTRPIQVRRITVTAAGLTVDTRTFFDAVGGAGAGAGAGAGGGAPATTANLTVTGTAGWMLTLTPADSSAFVNRLPILANGTVAFPVTPGSYTLKVEDGAGHMASQSITVPVAGLAVDVGPWLASQIRSAQGPTSADPAKGTVRLSGAPPQSVVAMPAAGLTHTVDATGRPVALDVLPGTYALTVTPIGSAPRAQSVTVVAGQTVDVTYGAMPTPSAQTDGTGLQPVDAMCGPVLNRAALPWAPATACPGNELTAPDGSRYRALASTGGVTLMQLKADGTVADAGMSLGTKVLIVGVVAAAGYAGWMWYSHRKPSGKQENPGKCSCGG